MRTVRTKVYDFEELSPEAQQVAIEWFREGQHIYLSDFNYDAEQQIAEAGFYDKVQVIYSLNNCQGDGLSFQASRIEDDVVRRMFKEVMGEGKDRSIQTIMDDCEFRCTGNNGRYCYASRRDLSYEYNGSSTSSENIERVVGLVEEKLQDLYMELCSKLEKEGYAEIEYQMSDEYIKDTIIANEYEFTKDGKKFNY